MSKKVAIVQSNYIPWKGYFDLINYVDHFIIYDDMQYTRRDWRNRNKIKTPDGSMWLTIPVDTKGKYHQKIRETAISDPKWKEKHWQTLVRNYSRSRCFYDYKELFEGLYLDCQETLLSQVNYRFMIAICEILQINTQISWSMNYELVEGQTERLVDLCKQVGATEYISGRAAKVYINEELFKREGIKLSYMDYSDYPEYCQRFPPFEHNVSILDLLFNEGEDATKFMKSFSAESCVSKAKLHLSENHSNVPIYQ